MEDYYKILGISVTATVDEIKKAYRKLAISYHPDKTQGDKILEEKFKAVSVAYDILGDKAKKLKYDESRVRPKWKRKVDNYDEFVKNSFNKEDTAGDRWGFKGNPFYYGKGDKRNRDSRYSDRARSNQGRTYDIPKSDHLDLTVPASISLVDTMNGGELKVAVARNVVQYDGKTSDGKIKYHIEPEAKDITIHLDTKEKFLNFKKTTSGYIVKVRVQKMGNEGVFTGRDAWGDEHELPIFGDLYIDVLITTPDNITLEDGHIVQTVDLPLYKILSEAEAIEIETITNKKYKAQINQPLTTTGLKFVLTGHGIVGSTGEIGDYIIKFNILTPDISKLKKKEKDQLLSILMKI